MQKLITLLALLCTITACKTKKEAVVPESYVFVIPSAFTPNGDGKNDEACFISPKQSTTIKGKISLYNRWGELIWETKNLTDCWDGINPKTNKPYPTGVYMVMIKQDGVEKLSGAVTLLL
ncbi:MAG: gliding motility-associated C-terminal domain-containing protein [bacterium]